MRENRFCPACNKPGVCMAQLASLGEVKCSACGCTIRLNKWPVILLALVVTVPCYFAIDNQVFWLAIPLFFILLVTLGGIDLIAVRWLPLRATKWRANTAFMD